jgi:hypothetical protein
MGLPGPTFWIAKATQGPPGIVLRAKSVPPAVFIRKTEPPQGSMMPSVKPVLRPGKNGKPLE